MIVEWPTAALGDVLIKSNNWIDIKPDERYRQVTVRLWGKGVVQRGEVSGAEIAAGRQLAVRTGQFILSRIDARNGAFGLVPHSLEGAVVSNDFPTFMVNTQRVLPSYLDWLSKTHNFVDLCKAASEGTTNRVRLKEDRFLATVINLPPLNEQRRIVARIEGLAAKIEEARSLRRQAVAKLSAMWTSALNIAFRPQLVENGDERSAVEALADQAEAFGTALRTNYNNAHPWEPNYDLQGPYKLPRSWTWTDLGSVLTHLIDCVNDTPDFASEPTGLLGLKSTNVRPYMLDLSQRWYMTSGDFDTWNRRERPQAGDILLTREAPMGNACILPTGIDACLTQRLMLLRTDARFVLNRYLLHYLNSPHFQNQVLEQCRGLTTPHIRVKDAPAIKLPLPPRSKQSEVVDYLDDLQAKVDAIKRMHTETTAGLDALLSSVLDKAFSGEL